MREQRLRFAEAMITDASGRLVAATNKTTDYFQADEDWWQECRAGPLDHVRVEDARWDASAQSRGGEPGAIVVNVIIPLTNARQEFAGVLKVSVDVGWLVEHLQSLHRPEDNSTVITLINGHGEQVSTTTAGPIAATQQAERTVDAVITPAALATIKTQPSGWITARRLAEEVIGYARVTLPTDRLPVDHNLDWYVVVVSSRDATLSPLKRLMWMIVGIGSLTIFIAFIAGFIIARREIIRPLLALRQGVEEFGRGNINYRLPVDTATRSFREDEIGLVAHAFNRMADELRTTVRRLEQAGLLKQQFIDVASHELRTPVTYILGVTQLAERQAQATGKENALASKVAVKARRLGRIVDNMMKLLNDGSFGDALQRGMVDLRSVLNTAASELKPFVDERSQKIEVNAASEIPAIPGDAEMLKDVLLNLLTNAIRFSPDKATIRVNVKRKGEFVEIEVVDQGTGISDEDLPHLFEPIRPVGRDDPMRHTSGEFGYNTRGIGLGLTVAKRFVELHGGRIGVQTSSEGTIMRVELPIHLNLNTQK